MRCRLNSHMSNKVPPIRANAPTLAPTTTPGATGSKPLALLAAAPDPPAVAFKPSPLRASTCCPVMCAEGEGYLGVTVAVAEVCRVVVIASGDERVSACWLVTVVVCMLRVAVGKLGRLLAVAWLWEPVASRVFIDVRELAEGGEVMLEVSEYVANRVYI